MHLLPVVLRSWMFFTFLDRQSFLNAAKIFRVNDYYYNIVNGKMNNYKTAEYAYKTGRYDIYVIYHKLHARGHHDVANQIAEKYMTTNMYNNIKTTMQDPTASFDVGKYTIHYLKYINRDKINANRLYESLNERAFVNRIFKTDDLKYFQQLKIPINVEKIIMARAYNILKYSYNLISLTSLNIAFLVLDGIISGPIVENIHYESLKYVVDLADTDRARNLFAIPLARDMIYETKSFNFLIKIGAPVDVLFKKAVEEDHIVIVKKLLRRPTPYKFPGCYSVRMFKLLENYYNFSDDGDISIEDLLDDAFRAGNIEFINFLRTLKK